MRAKRKLRWLLNSSRRDEPRKRGPRHLPASGAAGVCVFQVGPAHAECWLPSPTDTPPVQLSRSRSSSSFPHLKGRELSKYPSPTTCQALCWAPQRHYQSFWNHQMRAGLGQGCPGCNANPQALSGLLRAATQGSLTARGWEPNPSDSKTHLSSHRLKRGRATTCPDRGNSRATGKGQGRHASRVEPRWLLPLRAQANGTAQEET